jgi:ubiquinone/menaquinone biosynthesis C-methylase UbiE
MEDSCMASGSSTLFDRWSATYDRPGFQNATYRPIHDAVLRRLVAERTDMVVDLGCGTGQLTRRLLERYPDTQIVGVDYSNGMLGEASERIGDGAQLVQADAQYLPLRAGSADAVVCTESFHWYPDQARAAAGLAELLRPGGQLLIASIAAVTDAGEVAVRRLSGSGGQPIRALTPRRLRRLLADAGFDVIAQRRVPRAGLVPWPVLTDARRR